MKKQTTFDRRKSRVRFDLKKKAGNRLRLSVYRSEKNIYAQIIDDNNQKTLISASSKEKGFTEKGSTLAGAKAVGVAIAEKALKAGIKEIAFDRGGYQFHGRIKALADGAREAGLVF